jgi:hypothetical protein
VRELALAVLNTRDWTTALAFMGEEQKSTYAPKWC